MMHDRSWCEFCGDWYDQRHYDFADPLGLHLPGIEYGPYGRLLAIEVAARELVAHLNRLSDGEGNWSSAESFSTLEGLVWTHNN